jgi:hypothetical protein
MLQAWEDRFALFIEKLFMHTETRYKPIIYNFGVFRQRYKNSPEATFTRENIRFLSKEWMELAMITGQTAALQEFPDWPFIITQFQLFVLLSELRAPQP